MCPIIRRSIAMPFGDRFCPAEHFTRPGFESPEGNGPMHDGWWVYSKRGDAHAVVDKKNAHGGKQSVKLSGTPDARFVFLSPKLQVANEDEILFSGWIRCDQTQDTNRTGISIMFRARDGKIVDRSVVLPTKSKQVNGCC